MFDFDGRHKSTPKISYNRNRQETKEDLLQRAKIEREKREAIRLRNKSALLIQSTYRWHKDVSTRKTRERAEWDQLLSFATLHGTLSSVYTLQRLVRGLVFFFDKAKDEQRLEALCQLLIANGVDPQASYTGLARQPDQQEMWVVQVRKLLFVCLSLVEDNPRLLLKLGFWFTTPANLVKENESTSRTLSQRILRSLLERGLFIHLQRSVVQRMSSHVRTTEEESVLVDLLRFAIHAAKLVPESRTEFVRELLSIPRLTECLPKNVFRGLNQAFPPFDDVSPELSLGQAASLAVNMLRLLSVAGLDNQSVLKGLVHLIALSVSKVPGYALFRSEKGTNLDDDYDSDVEMDETPDIPFRYDLEVELSFLGQKAVVCTLFEKALAQLDNSKSLPIDPTLSALCSLYCKLATASNFHLKADILNALWTSTSAVRNLWHFVKSRTNQFDSLVQSGNPKQSPELADVFCMWALTYSQMLIFQDDEEFFEIQEFFSIDELRFVALSLKECLCQMLLLPDHQTEPLCSALVRLINQLYDRNSRQTFIKAEEWLHRGDRGREREKDKEHVEAIYLSQIPFVIPFQRRVEYFRRAITPDAPYIFGHRIKIRRDHLLEDSFNAFQQLTNEQLKSRIRVKFINEDGISEAGIDGGGLFKEFITECAKLAFNPEAGLFWMTPTKLLCPNPRSEVLFGADHLLYFVFLGKLVAKAILEGVLIDAPFAQFFLAKLLGKKHSLNDLRTLDPELYRNLMKLKRYKGNVEEDFGLTFAVADNEFGEQRTYDLVAGGRDISVTNENMTKYIYLVAFHKISAQIKPQSDAFLKGFRDLLDLEIIKVFSPEELQLLISGDRRGLDVEDLKANTNYGGGFTQEHPTIQHFWEVVRSFTPEQQEKLLRFVTSCPRPPLLGFSHLNPKFCIHQVPNLENLPTASTCFNLLKIGPYPTKEMLRERLLYAIESGAGFDLS